MIKKHKLLIFLLSLLAAIIFWIYVVTTIAPNTTGSVSGIPVQVYNEAVLEARGLIVTNYGTKTVRVDLQGPRATLSKLNSGNMEASLNLENITEPGEYDLSYTISFPDTVNSGDVNIRNKSVDKIHITVSEMATKSLRPELSWSGETKQGYRFEAGQVSFSPEKIEIKGPADAVRLVDAAVVYYDVSTLEQTTTMELPVSYLDAEGKQISLPTSVTANYPEVTVTLPVQRWKDIELKLDLDYGEGSGISAENVEVTLNTDTIRVYGETKVIESMPDTITLETIHLIEVEDGEEIGLTLSLPSGVTVNDDLTEVTATVRFTGLSYKTYSVTDIQPINVAEGCELTYPQAITVQLRGSRSVLQTISPEDIHITIDLSGYPQTGEYTVPFTVEINGAPEVGLVGKLDVPVSLTQS